MMETSGAESMKAAMHMGASTEKTTNKTASSCATSEWAHAAG